MEKRTPHYKLSKVQETVADPESQPFKITALRGGLELGLLEQEMWSHSHFQGMIFVGR
jgi:motility quorum-sensing regulator/GCU-specific mRNA interferase toxin